MASDGNKTLHGMMVLKHAGPSNAIYEIIMVSISGSMLLLAVIVIAVKVLRKQGKCCCSSNDPSTTEVVLANVTMKYNSGDKISTVDFTGPACINYFSEQEALPKELSQL